MTFSQLPEERKNIFAAFVAAQAEISAVQKDATNPHFGSKYADLSSILDMAQSAMKSHGLALTFGVEATDDSAVILNPALIHSSGEVITFPAFRIPLAQKNAQGQGSAITYGRRYLTQAILGIPTEDDDGNGASGAGKKPDPKPEPKAQQKAPPPKAEKPAPKPFPERKDAAFVWLATLKDRLKDDQFADLTTALKAVADADKLDVWGKEVQSALKLNHDAGLFADAFAKVGK